MPVPSTRPAAHAPAVTTTVRARTSPRSWLRTTDPRSVASARTAVAARTSTPRSTASPRSAAYARSAYRMPPSGWKTPVSPSSPALGLELAPGDVGGHGHANEALIRVVETEDPRRPVARAAGVPDVELLEHD